MAVAVITAIGLVVNSIMQRKQLNAMQQQIDMTKNEMVVRARPWIAHKKLREEQSISTNGTRRFWLDFKNYGQLPATQCKIIRNVSEKEINREDAEKVTDKTHTDNVGLVAPNMVRQYWMDMRFDDSPKDSKSEAFLSIIIEYEYELGKRKKARTGVIYQYNERVKEFVIVDSWATEQLV